MLEENRKVFQMNVPFWVSFPNFLLLLASSTFVKFVCDDDESTLAAFVAITTKSWHYFNFSGAHTTQKILRGIAGKKLPEMATVIYTRGSVRQSEEHSFVKPGFGLVSVYSVWWRRLEVGTWNLAAPPPPPPPPP